DLKNRLGWIGDARLLMDLPAQAPSHSPVRRGAIAVIVAAAAVAGFLVSRFVQPAAPPPGTPAARITRVSTAGMAPDVSMDGKMVTYIARRPGRPIWDIWVQQTVGGSAIRLTDDSQLTPWSAPVFSADGTRIYYRSEKAPAGVYEVAVLGGEP